MKTALPGIAWFTAELVAELYTVELRGGVTFYYTSLDVDIDYRGQTYVSRAFNVERGPIKTSIGTEVDQVELSLYPGQDEPFDGVSFPRFVLNGGFDGAWLTIERARQNRVTHLFKGMVTDAGADVTQIKLTLSAPTVLLNINMPHNQYSPGCIWSVYNTGCGLNRDAHAVAGSVTAGSTRRVVQCDLAQADDFFDVGKLHFTGGGNAGAVRSVRHYTSGALVLSYPLLHIPTAGDGFTVWPGCDKRYASCQAYGNEAHYRGFPRMPKKESSI